MRAVRAQLSPDPSHGRQHGRGAGDRAALRAARKPVLLAGGRTCAERGMAALARVQAAGVRVIVDTFVSRQARGAGRFAPGRMMYFAEMAMADLEGCDLMVLAEAKRPVAFFAYPDKPSVLVPEGCELATLAAPHQDGIAALEALAEALGAPAKGPSESLRSAGPPQGPLTPASIGDSLARHMPEGAIVCDEAITSSGPIAAATEGAQPHDWLMLLGGAIGQGLPLALGAAVAAPGRKVVAIVGDGSALYTHQALWSLAREGVDVTAVILANASYRILEIELQRTGAGDPGQSGRRMLSLDEPRIDWTALGSGLGVASQRCTDAEGFDAAFARAMAEPGPRLIEAAIP
jgi:acetolactate synthase-1/2/3 large subunit